VLLVRHSPCLRLFSTVAAGTSSHL
jgi:hypothetical protein